MGGCSLAALVLMGLVIEWRRSGDQGERAPWFVGALLLGLLMGFAALTIQGRPRRVAAIASLYLLLGAPVPLFAGAVVRAAGWA